MSEEKRVGIYAGEIEDYLMHFRVFQSGWDYTRIASLGAYGTVISWDNLEKAINEDSKYTKDIWLDTVEYWFAMAYLSPTFKLLGLWATRIVNKKFEEKPNE